MDITVDKEAFEYYGKNYSPMFLLVQRKTKGGFEVVNVLSGEVKHTYQIIDSMERCRYCGKQSPEVTFRKKAHAFSESIGNKLFISHKCECDICNDFFGTQLEPDLNTFLFPYLVINNIKGKKGQVKVTGHIL